MSGGSWVYEEPLSFRLPGFLAHRPPWDAIFVLLPIVSLLPISNFFFFFPEADTVISTQSAWPHSPARGSVTHGNEREAGDRTPHTHILSRPRPSLALAV